MRQYLGAIIMCTTVYEIIMFNLSKWCVLESFTFKKLGQYHELQRRRIRCWIVFDGLQDGKKWRIYVTPYLCCPQMRRSHGRTHIHIRIHTHPHI